MSDRDTLRAALAHEENRNVSMYIVQCMDCKCTVRWSEVPRSTGLCKRCLWRRTGGLRGWIERALEPVTARVAAGLLALVVVIEIGRRFAP